MRNIPGIPQVRFCINVWWSSASLLRRYFNWWALSGDLYFYIERADNFNLADRQRELMKNVHNYLIDLFNDRFIATREPVRAPLPYYNHGIFFWGFLKNELFKNCSNSIDDSHITIRNIIHIIDGHQSFLKEYDFHQILHFPGIKRLGSNLEIWWPLHWTTSSNPSFVNAK